MTTHTARARIAAEIRIHRTTGRKLRAQGHDDYLTRFAIEVIRDMARYQFRKDKPSTPRVEAMLRRWAVYSISEVA